jgi:Uncharacterised protein family (UPF0236)
VEEQLLRLGRRGRELRPFCQQAGVRPRGYSRRLQKALVDFGAEGAFAPAARRLREHYGVDVPGSGVRRWTLRHGQALATMADQAAPRKAAKIVVTEMDGSMVPVVQPGAGKDRRQGKTLFWREARLCCARPADSVTPIYGATLGSVGTARLLWRQTADLAGVKRQTYVHGVGDGAPWIVDQFTENFGGQGAYLIDFYHVSEYLAAAALTVAPGKERAWRRRQQGRLLDNRPGPILRGLEKHREALGSKEHPVGDAAQYLRERLEHLDYAGARRRHLPIGSGEIESGHRHVIQHRLKLSGAWWTERNLESMLQLRVARANQWWDAYWKSTAN